MPGILSSVPGMSPAKIAMAVAVTIEAMAGTGSMKKVIGTRSAVAMVAVRPGMAPTNIPKQAESRMTRSTQGSKTRMSASPTVCIYHSRSSQGLRGSGTRSSRPNATWTRTAARSATITAVSGRTSRASISTTRIAVATGMKPKLSASTM